MSPPPLTVTARVPECRVGRSSGPRRASGWGTGSEERQESGSAWRVVAHGGGSGQEGPTATDPAGRSTGGTWGHVGAQARNARRRHSARGTQALLLLHGLDPPSPTTVRVEARRRDAAAGRGMGCDGLGRFFFLLYFF